MAIKYPEILSFTPAPVNVHWSIRDTLLYALGVGAGDDPLDIDSLRYTYEQGLKAIPTFACTLAGRGEPTPAELGIDTGRMLHAGSKIQIHLPFLTEGRAITAARVSSALDKGPGKGALIVYNVDLLDPDSGASIATATTTLMARGDGGFGGPATGPGEPTSAPPQRPADAVVNLGTRPEQALLYRLSGEMNPLHADPQLARVAGFERPILQGPCTFGMTLRAVLAAWPDLLVEDVQSHEVRFAAPVVPGDTLQVRMWREGSEVIFEADVPAKGITVIKNGRTRIR